MPTPPRPAVAALEPYAAAETSIPGFDRPIRLGSNECGFAPSPRAVEAVAAAAGEARVYADADHAVLRAALARRHGLDAGKILCGAGSMDIMAQLAQCYLGPGRSLTMSRYGYRFPMTLARIAGADTILAEERGLVMDVDAMLAAVAPETAAVFAANPNNPTGTAVSFREIRRLAEGLPSGVMLWLDGAYGEFAERADYDTGERLVDEGLNVVTLRTFSKVYGLAGLRVGWAYAPADVVETVTRTRTPGGVPTPSLAGAVAALEDRDHVARVRTRTLETRERFAADARRLGLEPVDSEASFVLARVPERFGMDGEALYRAVRARGILLRRVANFGLPDCVRIGVGAPREMAALTEALADVLG